MTDAEKRDRAWTQMRRSHLREAALRVAATEARLAEARAALAADEAERAVNAEHHRGRRAYRRRGLRGVRAPILRAAELGERHRHVVPDDPDRESHREWLQGRVRACEAQLELDRRRHASLAAEARQQREFAKAIRTLYGAGTRGGA